MESIWQLAKNMEQEGIEFYRKLSEDTAISELAGVFYFLMEQEKVHLSVFTDMERGMMMQSRDRHSAKDTAKQIFPKIAPAFKDIENKLSAIDAYRKAEEVERKSVEYYTSLLPQAENEQQKKALEMIIEEERDHESIMQSIADFAEDPSKWIED